jgi:drug/metabolite transporter (DMT)-like permease
MNSALGISPVTANAWGMPIGAGALACVAIVSGHGFIVPTDGPYWIALFYLAVIGSVVGFTTYLLLVQRIGSARAGYATVAFPVVALIISTVFEDFQWTVAAGVGLCLIISGNYIMFARLRHLGGQRV